MATNTFDRKIEITKDDDVRRLVNIITAETPSKFSSKHPFSDAERNRGEQLLKQCSLALINN